MSEWQTKKISDIADVISGSTPSRAVSMYWNGDIPWVTPTEITKLEGKKYLTDTNEKITKDGLANSGAQLIPANSLLVTTRASLGMCAVNKMQVTTNQGFKSLAFKKDYSADFYYHLFKTLKNDLERRSSGTTFLEISGTAFAATEVPAPDKEEQKAIATVLDTVDEAIQSTQAMLDKQDKIKEGLLHDLLTCGVDECGNLRPSPEAAPELYQHTEIGLIPKRWEAEKLDKITVKIQDGTHFSPKTGGNEYLYITSKNIRFGFLDITTAETVDTAQHKEIYRRADVKTGDLLLTKDGANTGNAAINTIEDQISLLSSVAFLRFNERRDKSQFYLQYILSPKGQRRLKDLMSGNAITRLTLEKIRNFYVPRPSFKEQEKIANYLYDCDESTRENERHLQKLYRLKSGLMQDLLTGRKRVTTALMRDIEKLAEAA